MGVLGSNESCHLSGPGICKWVARLNTLRPKITSHFQYRRPFFAHAYPAHRLKPKIICKTNATSYILRMPRCLKSPHICNSNAPSSETPAHASRVIHKTHLVRAYVLVRFSPLRTARQASRAEPLTSEYASDALIR